MAPAAQRCGSSVSSSAGSGPGQQGRSHLLAGHGAQTAIGQDHVDGVPGRGQSRRHALQPRQIGQRVGHVVMSDALRSQRATSSAQLASERSAAFGSRRRRRSEWCPPSDDDNDARCVLGVAQPAGARQAWPRVCTMNSARRTLYPAAAPAWMVGGPRRRILDLGSGTGAFAQLLVDEGHEVFCIDRDVDVVAATTERLGTRLHVAGQVESLPYLSCHFDVVTSSQNLHKFAPGLALSEIARVLRPGWPPRGGVQHPGRHGAVGAPADRPAAAGRPGGHARRLRDRVGGRRHRQSVLRRAGPPRLPQLGADHPQGSGLDGASAGRARRGWIRPVGRPCSRRSPRCTTRSPGRRSRCCCRTGRPAGARRSTTPVWCSARTTSTSSRSGSSLPPAAACSRSPPADAATTRSAPVNLWSQRAFSA